MKYGNNTAEVERLLAWLVQLDTTAIDAIVAGNEVRRARLTEDELYGDVLRHTARTKEEVLDLERDRKATMAELLQRTAIDPESEPGKQLFTAVLVGVIATSARQFVTPGEFAIIVAPLRDAGYAFGDFETAEADYGPNHAEVERFFAWAEGADPGTARAIVTAEQQPVTPAEQVVRKTAGQRRYLPDLHTAFISRDVRAVTSTLFTGLGDGSGATRAALRSGIQVAANAIAKRHVLTADEFEIATRSVRSAGYDLDLAQPVYEAVVVEEQAEIAPTRYGPNTAEVARLIAWIARADRGTGLAILQADDLLSARPEGRARVPKGLPNLSASQFSALNKDRNRPIVFLGLRTVGKDMIHVSSQLNSVLITALSAVAARDDLPPEDFTRIVAAVAAAGYEFG